MSGHLATKVAKAKSRAGGQLCDFLSGTDANTYADKSMNIFSSGENLHGLLHQDVEKAGEVTKSCQSLRGMGAKMIKQFKRRCEVMDLYVEKNTIRDGGSSAL